MGGNCTAREENVCTRRCVGWPESRERLHHLFIRFDGSLGDESEVRCAGI